MLERLTTLVTKDLIDSHGLRNVPEPTVRAVARRTITWLNETLDGDARLEEILKNGFVCDRCDLVGVGDHYEDEHGQLCRHCHP
jgi:hypothetical protein